jgi:hypothetical protein
MKSAKAGWSIAKEQNEAPKASLMDCQSIRTIW